MRSDLGILSLVLLRRSGRRRPLELSHHPHEILWHPLAQDLVIHLAEMPGKPAVEAGVLMRHIGRPLGPTLFVGVRPVVLLRHTVGHLKAQKWDASINQAFRTGYSRTTTPDRLRLHQACMNGKGGLVRLN
jgi:hypothetical protein